MPDPVTSPRVLPEQEFNAIRDRLLQDAPSGMDEASFNRWIGPRMASAIAVAEHSPAPVEGSAVGRFLSNAGEMLNPVSAAEGVYNAVRHPVDTAGAILSAQGAQGSQAVQAFKAGDYSSAIGHGVAAAVPLVGPAAAQAGEQIANGDIAGGFGKGVGLLLPAATPAIARGASSAVRAVVPEGARAALADAADAGAAKRVADVMAPKVGANKTRFGGMAEKVAPDLAGNPDMAAWSRQGLHGNVQAGLEQAGQALDTATDARNPVRPIPTKPLIDALLEKRKALTAEAVDASKPVPKTIERTSPILDESGNPITVTSKAAVPIGSDVVPAPNAARVAQIDQAISELKQLGPVARYDDLRTIRQAYDGPAKAIYNPSMTQDFIKAQGGKLGAADVTGAFRDYLGKVDPTTAAANAQYSLMKTANDVLDATAEVERTRPKVGRRIIARLTGTILGTQAGGAAGAVAGYAAGPFIDGIVSSGWTTQLKTAQLLSKLATAVRSGDEGYVMSLSQQLKRIGAQAATLTGNAVEATSPSGPQTAPAPSR